MRNHILNFAAWFFRLAGWAVEQEDALPDTFKPPNVKSLAEVDLSNVEYPNECVIIDGLVSLRGQGAGIRNEDGYSVHIFTLAAWRELDGPIMERDLIVLRPIPPEHNWSGEFPSFSVRRMSVLLSKEGNRAVFDRSLPTAAPDTELVSIADRLRQPVGIQTSRLGELVLDRSLNWFEGEVAWNGEMVRVTIPADENESTGNTLETAESLWSDQTSWKNRIENYAMKELLELKNGTWLQDDESEFTPEDFIARMSVESIHVLPDGEFEFWYDDGDLFWGHSIMVSGNIKDGPEDAGIHG